MYLLYCIFLSLYVGAAFGARQINVDDTRITLGIWDTAGSERYESMSRIYYRAAAAAVICYDITNQQSFDRVRYSVSGGAAAGPFSLWIYITIVKDV